ncbi:MAG: hypothetical protein Q4F54_04720 [Coriobacteriia bacterium]|nr:hypothetical protein [Coriobacteriia bacterium]
MISVSPSVDAEVRIHEVIDPYAPSPDFRFGIPGMSKVPLDGEAYQMTMYSQSTWDKYLSE